MSLKFMCSYCNWEGSISQNCIYWGGNQSVVYVVGIGQFARSGVCHSNSYVVSEVW